MARCLAPRWRGLLGWGRIMADETIIIDGDARGGVAATAATSAAYRRMAVDIAGATDQMRRQVERDRVAMAKAAEKQAKAEREAAIDSVNAWKRADVAGIFRPWLDAREEYLEGAEKVGKAAMAQRVALLGLASGVTIAVTATLAAGAALVGSAVDVIAHADAQTLAMSTHRAELVEGHAAYVGLTTEVTRLRVELAGQLAPALTTTFDAMAGGLSVTTDLTRGLSDVADAIGLDVAATSRYIPVLGQLLTSMDVLAAHGKQVRLEAEAAAKLAAAHGPRFDVQAEAQAVGEGGVRLWAGGRINMEAEIAAGRLVEVLVDESRGAGRHTVDWQPDGRASGVYFARFSAERASAREAAT